MSVINKIVNQNFLSIFFQVTIHNWNIHILYKHSNFSCIPTLPQKSRDVEECSLEEKCKADPLVIFVILALMLVSQVCWRSNTRVRNLIPNLSQQSVWYAECCMNPAVGVHHIWWDIRVHDAINRVPYVLPGGDEEATCDKDNNRGLKRYLQLRISSQDDQPCSEA